ncbi:MAG TPA: GldG family protein [Burkholderiales bacterium]|nr:GldG family protein [Burkholderiales bacterium]
MHKKTENLLYSAGGLVAAALILVLLNFVLGAVRGRIDLTQGKLYTLSEGTRAVLGKLESPVKIRLYFSQNDVPLPIKAYGRRVEDLLAEFRQAGRGKVTVEKLDPQPDSDAEDSATLEGVQAQVTPSGDKFYLGASISYTEQKVALPALTPDREPLLEYDLVRAIARAVSTTKPVIGVMSALPVFGMPPSQFTGGQPLEPQVIIGELRRDYTVKRVSLDAERIDDDIKVLLVIHPRGIGERAQYALDQFVLRGGKLIAFLDPSAYFDQMGQMGGMGGGGTPSSLDKLLKAWGLAFDSGKVVLDMRYVTGAGVRTLPTLLSLNDNAFDPKDITTARLGALLMPFAGVFTGKPVEGLDETVLMKTSAYSQLVESFAAMTQGEAAIRGFKPSGIEYPLAIRLTGKFKTAFPEGRPAPEDKGDKNVAKAPEKKAAKASDPKAESASLKESAAENAVVLVGDSDFINDGAAVQIQEIFGQRIVIPRNGNLAFAQALVDQFAGDPALINLRSRASAARPFTVIRDMEAKAQQAYLGKIKDLEDNLGQTQEKLNALQKGRGQGAGAILSAGQQTELENFRRKAAETRLALKEVRRELRADSEALQFWTKVGNIALMPLVVAIAGIALAILRRRRTPAL